MTTTPPGQSMTTFFPLEAEEIARLVPMAANQMGWRESKLERTEAQTWKFEISTGGLPPLTGAVIVERRANLWTAVRFSWEGGPAFAPRECERFLRSLVLLSDGDPRPHAPGAGT